MFRLCVILMFSLVLGSSHVRGQDSLPPPGMLSEPAEPFYTSAGLYAQLPPEIQEELNEEAQKIYTDCSFSSRYAQFHDCRCLAIQYLDKRIMKGPEATEAALLTAIAGECVNDAGVAGYYYPQCKAQFSSLITSNIEEFCTCYANQMAKNYAKQPSLYHYHLRNLTSAAFRSCKGSYFVFGR